MAVIEETTTIYRCSDGSTYLNKLDAEIREADLALKDACEEHGYSGPSFSRDFLYDFLTEHGHHFAGLLVRLVELRALREAEESKKRSSASRHSAGEARP